VMSKSGKWPTLVCLGELVFGPGSRSVVLPFALLCSARFASRFQLGGGSKQPRETSSGVRWGQSEAL